MVDDVAEKLGRAAVELAFHEEEQPAERRPSGSRGSADIAASRASWNDWQHERNARFGNLSVLAMVLLASPR
jgi:hypothetical protein